MTSEETKTVSRIDDIARILRQRKEGAAVTAKVIRRAKEVELSTER